MDGFLSPPQSLPSEGPTLDLRGAGVELGDDRVQKKEKHGWEGEMKKNRGTPKRDGLEIFTMENLI